MRQRGLGAWGIQTAPIALHYAHFGFFLGIDSRIETQKNRQRNQKELISDSKLLTCRMNQDSQFLILRNRHCTNKFSSVVCSKRLGAQKAHGNSYVQPVTPSQWFNIISDRMQEHLIGNFIRIKSLIFLIKYVCFFSVH